jgi:hypothetical protein
MAICWQVLCGSRDVRLALESHIPLKASREPVHAAACCKLAVLPGPVCNCGCLIVVVSEFSWSGDCDVGWNGRMVLRCCDRDPSVSGVDWWADAGGVGDLLNGLGWRAFAMAIGRCAVQVIGPGC